MDPTEYHDEYSETLGTEFRKLEDALLSDTVGLLASSEPIRLRESASVAEALQRMTEQGRGAVVVIDEEGRLASIFTQGYGTNDFGPPPATPASEDVAARGRVR
jgi:CBS domain-containing protein